MQIVLQAWEATKHAHTYWLDTSSNSQYESHFTTYTLVLLVQWLLKVVLPLMVDVCTENIFG